MIKKIRACVAKNKPLIHCITNPISINQCANVILSTGAKPMMAQHPDEAAEITSAAGALLLNLGNITDTRKQAMLASAKASKEKDIKYVLDVCGAACLKTRREFALDLVRTSLPSVVKGNYSEIVAMHKSDYSSCGVDSDPSLDCETAVKAAVDLADKLGTVVLASGATDIITDAKRLVLVKNGTRQLGKITGTGCMQGALCAAYLSESDGFNAALAASVVFGICGQLAQTPKGSGSFFVNLLDALSTITDQQIQQLINTEEKQIEKI